MRLDHGRVARSLLTAALVIVAAGCGASHDTCGGTTGCTRVLFIGNSYTYVNDLPATFVELAHAGGHAAATDSVADGGATLADALASSATADKLAATA